MTVALPSASSLLFSVDADDLLMRRCRFMRSPRRSSAGCAHFSQKNTSVHDKAGPNNRQISARSLSSSVSEPHILEGTNRLISSDRARFTTLLLLGRVRALRELGAPVVPLSARDLRDAGGPRRAGRLSSLAPHTSCRQHIQPEPAITVPESKRVQPHASTRVTGLQAGEICA